MELEKRCRLNPKCLKQQRVLLKKNPSEIHCCNMFVFFCPYTKSLKKSLMCLCDLKIQKLSRRIFTKLISIDHCYMQVREATLISILFLSYCSIYLLLNGQYINVAICILFFSFLLLKNDIISTYFYLINHQHAIYYLMHHC